MNNNRRFWTSLHGGATVALIMVALYFIFIEHAEHTLQYLPFMIILLCPLMHIFMHKGHHRHQHSGKETPDLEEIYRRGYEAGRRNKHSD